MAAWLKDGSLKRRFHLVKGLQNAPEAVNLLFSGGNTGKLYVFSGDLDRPSSELLSVPSSRVVQVSEVSAKL